MKLEGKKESSIDVPRQQAKYAANMKDMLKKLLLLLFLINSNFFLQFFFLGLVAIQVQNVT